MMRRHTVGVIGWPVDRSLSPAIHNAAFKAMRMDWHYVPLPVRPGELEAALGGLMALGFRGANVTMPHKTDAAQLMDARSEDAKRVGAVNTVVVGEDSLTGHNTDVAGFARFLERDVGFDPAGRTALILGRGGAARACALALVRGGLDRLVVAAREPLEGPQHAAFAAAVGRGGPGIEAVPWDEAHDVRADLVVNATPVGGKGEAVPAPPPVPGMTVVDLLYRPPVTRLVASARAAGADAHGGLGLLLHQAALSFELWTGVQPPFEAMSAAALAALAESGG